MYFNKPNRANFWNYNNPGYYFITIVTKNRKSFFEMIPGDLNGSNRRLRIPHKNRQAYTSSMFIDLTIDHEFMNSTVYKIANSVPNESLEFGKIAFNCWIDIPKHYPECELDEFVIMPNHVHGILLLKSVPDSYPAVPLGDRHACHLTGRVRNTERIPSIVGSFKSAVSNKIHLLGNNEFGWQKSFHDRVIRNDRELFLIQRYIRNNPMNWERDKLVA